MKKHKSLTLLLLLTTFMVGCGSETELKQIYPTTSSRTMDKTPITLTLFQSNKSDDMPFDDDVAKKITELTGVKLKITHPVAGDTQAIQLMIASGDYPDLIYAKADAQKLIDAGAIIKLDDYIDKKGDNIKALYGDNLKRLKNSKVDPSIYEIGSYGVSTEKFDPDGSMQLQHAVLKALGYPEIKTLKDYEKAIKDYIAKYPEINGKKTIGMTLLASDWRWVITCGNIAGKVVGIPDDGQFAVNEETKKATYKFELPEVKEYFKWLNHMNAEGLLDPESFTQKQDVYYAKLAQGNVLGITDAKWSYGDFQKSLVAAGMDERTFCPLPVTLSDKYKEQSLKDYGYNGGWGISISSTSKNKDRAFEFLNWLASDEAQVLLNWGIEGEHYKVENGKRVLLPEVQQQMNTDKDFKKKTGIGLYIDGFPQRGDGAVDPTGNTYTTNTLDGYISNYSKAEKETLAAYGKKSFVEFFPSAQDLGQSKHGQLWNYNASSDLTMILKKADDYTQKAITQAILGSPEDFDSAWDKIQVDLKAMGIDKVDQGYSDLIVEKMELWK